MGTGGSVASRKIKYLQQASYLRKRLQLQISQLGTLYAMAEYKPISYSEDKSFTPSLATSPMEGKLVQCLALEEQIRATADSYNTVTTTIRDALYKLDDTQQQLLLEARYLNDMSWSDIADLLGVSSMNRCFQIHRQAIKAIVLPLQ